MAAVARPGVLKPRNADYKLSHIRGKNCKQSCKIPSIPSINTSSCKAGFSGRKNLKSPSRSSKLCCCLNEFPADKKWGTWDLNFGGQQLQAAAAKLGDTFRGMLRKFEAILEDIILKGNDEENSEWEWEKWQEYFHLVDREEKLMSILKLHLEDAVKSEDYKEAARLKLLIAEITAYDTAGEVMSQLKKAVEEEHYRDAAKLWDVTCAGLVGWWAGLAESANDPYGRIIRISPEHGRFVATSYNARQLSQAGPGVPLFEIFITKDDDQEYKQQAVYLQRDGESAHGSLAKPTEESDTDMEKNDDAELGDEGLRRVLKFLRAGMPGLKFKVLRVATPERADMDIISGVFDQLMQDINKEKDEGITSSEGAVHEFKTDGDLHNDKVSVGGFSDIMELIEVAAAKVAIGTLLQSIAEDAPPSVPVRVPAKIEKRGRESFSFHIENDGSQQSAGGKEMTHSWKVATVARQTSADPMSAGFPKVPWNVNRVPAKALQDFGDIITLAVSEAQKRRGLHTSTVFNRINIEAANSDPFSGLYTGTFGPYNSEVIQLRHRFGHWHDDNNATQNKESMFEFYEYVEAVKLTGDMIVPAGQVTFRAKIGKENQLPHRDIFPEELGVVARYKGEERRAQSGFQNQEWADAELLLLDGKGTGATTSPHLGFLFSVAEYPILVLFKRLNLSA